MARIDHRSGSEIIDLAECQRLLAGASVGRLAVIEGAWPHIMPVNYVMDGDAVVFRSADGTKIDRAIRGPVAFEVDEIDAEHRSGWSVVVHGEAREVTAHDEDLFARLLGLGVDPWAPGEKPHLVRIEPVVVTGRRVGRC